MRNKHPAIDTHPFASDTDILVHLSIPREPWAPRITQGYRMYGRRAITLLNHSLPLDIFYKHQTRRESNRYVLGQQKSGKLLSTPNVQVC